MLKRGAPWVVCYVKGELEVARQPVLSIPSVTHKLSLLGNFPIHYTYNQASQQIISVSDKLMGGE